MVSTQIRYITPFSLTKNIGGEYNKVISELPDDCWIVLRDLDTMFLTSDCGVKIADIINSNQGYDVITCMTNRLGLKDCLLYGEMNDYPIDRQIEIAKTCWNDWGVSVSDTKVAPGMLMMFRKSTWENNRFKENSIIFDREFSASVIRKGGKIGIAKGLYIFHLYRYGQKNPQNYISHLK